MKTILCFGDSITWGFNAKTKDRHPYEDRWTSVLQQELGNNYHILNESLGGRIVEESVMGSASLAKMILSSDVGPAGSNPKLLLISPPLIENPSNFMGMIFNNRDNHSTRFPELFDTLSNYLEVPVLHSTHIVKTSPLDGIHLDAEKNVKLGKAVSEAILKIEL